MSLENVTLSYCPLTTRSVEDESARSRQRTVQGVKTDREPRLKLENAGINLYGTHTTLSVGNTGVLVEQGWEGYWSRLLVLVLYKAKTPGRIPKTADDGHE